MTALLTEKRYRREKYTRTMQSANQTYRLVDPGWQAAGFTTSIQTTNIKAIRFGLRGSSGALLRYSYNAFSSGPIQEPYGLRPAGYFEDLEDGIANIAFASDTAGEVLEVDILRVIS